jgi:hypothetical protein
MTSTDTYISCPDINLSEGEIYLEKDSGDSDERVLAFIKQLCQAVLQPSKGADRKSPVLSSLSTRDVGGGLTGRLYGQAWVEKQGDTVAFLRVKLINEQGEAVMTAMATSHSLS